MKRQHKIYTPSFKKKAVELSFSMSNIKQTCEELDMLYYIVDEKNQNLMVRTVF